MNDLPPELIDETVKGNVVLFVGGGPSIRAGLPDKVSVYRELAERINCTAETDILKVAQYYQNRNGRNTLIRQFQEAFDTTQCRITTELELLAQLPVKVIIATAYDDLLERAMRQAQRQLKLITVGVDLPYWDETWINLVKLHGSVNRPTTLVITQQDYSQYFRTHRLVAQQLSALLATKTFLFLGYSLDDPAFNQLYEELAYDLAEHQRRAFIVTESANSFDLEDLRHHNFTVIELTALNSESEDSGDLSSFLRGFLTAVADEKGVSTLPMPPVNFVGRKKEIAELFSLVWEQCMEPIVIYGPAGIGKTTLAKHFVTEWMSECKGIALWLDVINPDLSELDILYRLLRYLGINYTIKRPDLDREILLGEAKRIVSGKRALIVLDHVSSSDTVRRTTSLALLSDVDILITTRDEAVAADLSSVSVKLGPLSSAESIELIKNMVPALDFESEQEPIKNLASAVDGNPLYLDMLAKGIRQVYGQEISRLKEIVSHLTSTATELHIGESRIPVVKPLTVAYQSLTPQEQRLFQIVGLLGPTDFADDVIVEISGQPQDTVEFALEHLVDLSLLTRKQDGRFFCPPLLKEFAIELVLNSHELEHHYLAFQEYCFNLANSLGSIDIPREILESHLEQVRAGLKWCLDRRDWIRCRQYSEIDYRWTKVSGKWDLVADTDWFLGEFRAADFSRSSLSASDFSASVSKAVDFARSWITQMKMYASDFRGADFERAQLIGVDFRGGDLRGVDFAGARLFDVDFSGADLRSVDFTLARLNKVKFVQCDLRGADFTKAIGIEVNVAESSGFSGFSAPDSMWLYTIGVQTIVQQCFESIYAAIDKHSRLNSEDKQALKWEVEELQAEVIKSSQASESILSRRLRNIGRVAPNDILDIVQVTLSRPESGFVLAVPNVAETLKSLTENS